MEDNTTIVESNMGFIKLDKIVESWALGTKFSVREKSEKRILYFKNIRLNTAWLSIENRGETTKITAWFAPKSLGPDDKGSFWSGYKYSIHNSLAFGPIAIYRKQFNKLMEMLKTTPDNLVISQKGSNDQQKRNKGAFVNGLVILGIIEIVSGVLSVLSASTFLTDYPDTGNMALRNGIFDMVLGVLIFVSSRMLKNGKALAIWLYGSTILLNVAYETAISHKLPYFSVVFGALITWQLFNNKEEWNLL